MKNQIIRISIYLLLLRVLYAVAKLSYLHATVNDTCPLVISIPACYIILFSVLGVLFAHYLKRKQLFFIFANIPLLIALAGSVLQILGKVACPKNEANIPMCFISLGIFLAIVGLKLLEKRYFDNAQLPN